MMMKLKLKRLPLLPTLLLAACGTDDDPAETDVDTDVSADADVTAADVDTDLDSDTAEDADAPEPDADAVEDLVEDSTPDADAAEDVQPDAADAEPDAFPADPMEWEIGQAGPYNVGYRAYEMTYDRPDIDGTRTISVGVWYPTNDTSGRSPAYLDVFLDTVPFEDAEPAPSPYEGGYPVHVHSHGFQGHSGTSAFLMRHYASHGWLAISPDHIGNTLLDHVDPLDNAHYFLKSIDISESLDMLDELPDGDPLQGLSSTAEVIMSGHSFGTYACWSVAGATYDTEVVTSECEDLSSGPCTPEELGIFLGGELGDSRVVATVPMAGTYRTSWFGDAGHESVDIPILALTGSEDGIERSQAQWDALGAGTDMTWVDLEGGCHQTFALGGCTTLPMVEGFEIVNSYVLAFGRAHVLGDDSANTLGVLDGSVEVSERATLLRSEQ